MERPQIDIQPKQRNVTGEIVYLDGLRRRNETPKQFLDLGDMAIQFYEAEAAMCIDDIRPAIMDEYERYDNSTPSETVASCIELANILLTLEGPDNKWSFVNVMVDVSPDTVLSKLEAISAGSILASANEQLAIESDDKYYPIVDIRKQNANLIDVGVRVWGWDDKKYVYTNEEGEACKYPQHFLMYPSDEKNISRQIDLSFAYVGKDSGRFTESVSLNLKADGSVAINTNIFAMAYAETGYEGHKRTSLDSPSEVDVAAFGDLIAEIVGDTPESVGMRVDKVLKEITDTAVTPSAKKAVQKLMKDSWPVQAHYFLTRGQKGSDKTLAELLQDAATVDSAEVALNKIIKSWKTDMRG